MKEGLSFGPGDVIEGTFILKPIFLAKGLVDRRRLGLLFDNGMMNAKHGDVIAIEIDPREFGDFAPMFSRRFEGRVRLVRGRRGKFLVSQTIESPGEIVGDLRESSLFNPPEEALRAFPRDTPVSVEGTVVKVSGGHVRIDVGGRILRVSFTRGWPRYGWATDPRSEGAVGEPVREGDRIRVIGLIYGGEILAATRGAATLLCAGPETCEVLSAAPPPKSKESFLGKIQRAIFGRVR